MTAKEMCKRNRVNIDKVIDWLERNVNKTGYLYFKVTAWDTVTAYFNKGYFANKPFAYFEMDKILKIIEMEGNNDAL